MKRATLATAVALALLSAPAEAARQCPAKQGRTLAAERNADGDLATRIWRHKGVVKGCTTYHPSRVRTRRLGRIKPRLLTLDGQAAAWTTRKSAADRVTAIDLATGVRWFRRRRALPRTAAGEPRGDAKISRLALGVDGGVLWQAGAAIVAAADGTEEGFTVTAADGTESRPYTDASVALVATGVAPGAPLEIRAKGLEGDDCGYLAELTFTWGDGTNAVADVFNTNPFC